jgi:ABC-type maltose transport system permease subunit
MFNYEIKILIYRHFPLGSSNKAESAMMSGLTDNRKNYAKLHVVKFRRFAKYRHKIFSNQTFVSWLMNTLITDLKTDSIKYLITNMCFTKL